ncbi:MAG: flagella basal body P-ring formation protein FlgA [Halioglobus sp.]|jgi:flagella basal body P-ring formation protein FlgA
MEVLSNAMTKFWHYLLAITLVVGNLVFVISSSSAESMQTLESIVAAAATSGAERAKKRGYESVKTEVRPLDSRLRLPQCSQALSTLTPATEQVLGSVNIGVRCSGDKPWTIYVRTNVSATQSIPVLARPMVRGAIITSGDLLMVEQPLHSAAKGAIYDPNQIIGMELVRALDAGSQIRVSQLRLPKVVLRGQQVTLIASFNGLDVRIQGKALKDAAAGDRVAVTNLSSGKRVEGIAHSDGTVWVQ